MKKLVVTVLISVLGISIQAQQKNKNAEYTIGVSGNCEMCKKRIEKAARSVKGVKYALWNVDSKNLQLIVDENKCTISQIHEAVAKAGHDTDEVRATDEAYNSLHSCCQFERRE